MLGIDFKLNPFNRNRQLTMLYFINMDPLVCYFM